MNGFVPRGYLTLRQAVDRVAQSLLGDAWQGTILSEDERTALARQEQAAKLLRAVYTTRGQLVRGGAMPGRRPDRQELEEQAAETPEIKAAKAKLKRRERLRNSAMEPLRQALFAGQVSAVILSEGGRLSEVPNRVWGSAEATDVFRTGKAEFSTRRAPYDGSSTVGGRVLLDEASVDGWLTPTEPGPAHTSATPADETAPEMESPDPYKTGLPGRPTIRHLIEEEFRRRITDGTALRVLPMEARELHAWAIEQHPDAPVPTVKTIVNQIRELHRRYVEMTRK
jgi:hypothetical protein